ncbi:serine protease [Methyloversatilis sp.]|uniref:S1 family peptidase n=1 Tax=Methyloversatilis sp. TaxID=2569862 RepID=UPI0027333DCE|nr:serine protease [Methyloversatilis sp.]MDP2869072.1 serine protease [Methyloversatilis sp.]MDP3453895.1 serine protease [Methyloversatilis sp.]MDP3579023.1 serine protease [Methyloversatilis sp.]
MIRLSALLACCLGLSSAATANEVAEEFGSAFYTGLSISVVQVRVLNAAGKGYFGSGVVVAENEVITNCHVTRQAVRVEVAKGALVYPVFGQKADMANDLCLLRTGPMPLRVAELRDAASVKAGEKSFYYGYSGGIEAFFAPGRVATTHPHDGMAVIETSSGFALGGSGGGLFDARGRLMGITTFLASGHAGGYFAMPAEMIRRVRTLPESDVAPIDGLAIWEQPDPAQPWFLRVARMGTQARWQAAAELANEWTQAQPDNADAWHQSGVALSRLDRHAEALAALQNANALSPGHPQILFHTALALSRIGRSGEATHIRNELALADTDLAGRLDKALENGGIPPAPANSPGCPRLDTC